MDVDLIGGGIDGVQLITPSRENIEGALVTPFGDGIQDISTTMFIGITDEGNTGIGDVPEGVALEGLKDGGNEVFDYFAGPGG